MAVADQIARIQTAKENIKTSLSAKGVDVGDAKLDEYSTFIDAMEVGGDMSEYFTEGIPGGTSSLPGFAKSIKKLPINTPSGTSANYMFNYYEGEIPKLTGWEKVTYMSYCFANTKIETGLELDTSNVLDFSYAYQNSNLKTVPTYNLQNATTMQCAFQSTDLEEIPLFILGKVTNMNGTFRATDAAKVPALNFSTVQRADYCFAGMTNLIEISELDFSSATRIDYLVKDSKNITTLGGFKNLGQAYLTTQSANYFQYKLDLSQCTNLTHDSLMNIINNLYDIATKGCKTQQLVLGATNLAKLTEEEIAIATNKGWTVS